MQFLTILGCALSLGWTSAWEVEARATSTPACPYPGIQSSLLSCKTGKAFCKSFLGRGPTTTTVSVPTYTTTVPASTFTDEADKNITISKTTTVPVVTITTTAVSCADTEAPGAGAQVKVAAATTSCGVGSFSSAWVSTACECDFDKTIYHASTTKTKKSGTTILSTTKTYITTTTATVASVTSTVTTTTVYDNCYPPSNATCLNPGLCEFPGYQEFYTFICGSDHEYACSCGYDSHMLPTCFNENSIDCTTANNCNNDYDCAVGEFCLFGYYCTCEAGPPGTCAKLDVCLGDVLSIVTPTFFSTFVAEATEVPGLNVHAG